MSVKYFLFTLGCQMNISDSQRIAKRLAEIGLKPASEKEAGLVIVNACSVRQSAVDRIWGKIKKWQAGEKQIIITGCVLATDKKKFAQKGINFFEIKSLNHLDKILSQNFNSAKDCQFDYFDIQPEKQDDVALIPIMTGCDNFCSYCAVPLTRGREISRPFDDCIRDIKNALKNGAKKILLLGQNINSYRYGFDRLLLYIDKLPSDFKFNFISSNPHDMTKNLINTLAKLKKWPAELHLPLQSGDDEILKKMNRKYTSGQYLALISNLKTQISNLYLSTDIIVGFPGETKKQFENTLKLCKKIKFNKAYIAKYSPRPGTAAAKLKDDISPAEKKRRWEILEKLINSPKNKVRKQL